MSKIKPNKMIVIVGPTASGKSDLAIRVAKKVNGEIISADSRQVYIGMDVGSGKITKKEMGSIPHHMLSVISPKKDFSVSTYVKMAKPIILDIQKRGRVPVIVGGTGFYIDSLVYSIPLSDVKPDKKLRSQLETKSLSQLQSLLKKLDPEELKRIDVQNKRRLIRSIEIAKSGIKNHFSITDFYQNKIVSIGGIQFKPQWIGLQPKQEDLNRKIKLRLIKRFKGGMMREIKRLKESGLSHKKLENFGLEYKWGSLLLRDKVSKDDFINGIVQDIIRYSKRQLKWFKRNKNIKWFRDPKKVTL